MSKFCELLVGKGCSRVQLHAVVAFWNTFANSAVSVFNFLSYFMTYGMLDFLQTNILWRPNRYQKLQDFTTWYFFPVRFLNDFFFTLWRSGISVSVQDAHRWSDMCRCCRGKALLIRCVDFDGSVYQIFNKIWYSFNKKQWSTTSVEGIHCLVYFN